MKYNLKKLNKMNKQLLVEYIAPTEAKLSLNEGKTKDGRLILNGKLQHADEKNGNGRIYPREILEREINKYINEQIKTRTSTGELDHPDSDIINLKNISHIITNVTWKGDEVWGTIELLNTPSGKIAQEIVLAGIPLGISSRAMGSVKTLGETVEVQDDLSLLCWDLVSTPSTPKAYMNLSESLVSQNYSNKYSTINSLIMDIICLKTLL
jgi:hypothetical protein